MLKPAELSLDQMEELASIIPGPDPEVRASVAGIPTFEQARPRAYIPVCEPTLGGRELEYVTQAVQTNWISSAGSFIRQFESEFARKSGARHGIACANCTVSLHLALSTLGLEPGPCHS